MKFRLIIILSMLFLAQFSTSQTPFKVSLANEATDKLKEGHILKVIGNRTNGLFILVKDKNETLYVKKVANDNTLTQTQVVPAEFKNKYLLGSFKLGGQYYFIAQTIQQKGFSLTAYEIDNATGKVKLPGKILLGNSSAGFSSFGINYYVTKDGKKLWLEECQNSEDNTNAIVTCTLFDENLRQLKKFNADLGLKNKLVDMMNFDVDDNALYCLYKKYVEVKNEENNHKPYYTYEVVNLNNAKPAKVSSVILTDKFVLKARMTCYKNQITIAGYYSKKKFNHMNGLFTCIITDGKSGENNFIEFTDELTARYDEKCAYPALKKDFGPHADDMHLQDVTTDPLDGATYITGQSYTENTGTQGGAWTNIRNIYTAKINADGSLAYSTKIPYNRVVNYSLSGSIFLVVNPKTYSTFIDEGKQYFLLSESKDNKKDALRFVKNGVDIAYVTDASGALKKYPTGLSCGASEEYKTYPNTLFEHTDNNEFVFTTKEAVVFYHVDR